MIFFYLIIYPFDLEGWSYKNHVHILFYHFFAMSITKVPQLGLSYPLKKNLDLQIVWVCHELVVENEIIEGFWRQPCGKINLENKNTKGIFFLGKIKLYYLINNVWNNTWENIIKDMRVSIKFCCPPKIVSNMINSPLYKIHSRVWNW